MRGRWLQLNDKVGQDRSPQETAQQDLWQRRTRQICSKKSTVRGTKLTVRGTTHRPGYHIWPSGVPNWPSGVPLTVRGTTFTVRGTIWGAQKRRLYPVRHRFSRRVRHQSEASRSAFNRQRSKIGKANEVQENSEKQDLWSSEKMIKSILSRHN